jgi:hypothetical protein
MRYKILVNSLEKKIIGKYPQSSLIDSSVEFMELWKQMEKNENNGKDWNKLFLNHNVNISISQSTKLTDFLMVVNTSRGIVINDNFFSVLNNFNLPESVKLNVQVFLQKKNLVHCNYRWINIESTPYKYIDFEKSIFQVNNYINDSLVADFQLKNEDELKLKILNLKFEDVFFPKILFLKKEFNFDFFRFDFFQSGNYYISENLEKSLFANNLNGWTTKLSEIYQ